MPQTPLEYDHRDGNSHKRDVPLLIAARVVNGIAAYPIILLALHLWAGRFQFITGWLWYPFFPAGFFALVMAPPLALISIALRDRIANAIAAAQCIGWIALLVRHHYFVGDFKLP